MLKAQRFHGIQHIMGVIPERIIAARRRMGRVPVAAKINRHDTDTQRVH